MEKNGKFIILGNQNKIEPKYTWNIEWAKEYESPWGMFEKFKFANNVNSKYILSLFGSKYVKNLKVLPTSYCHCELITMAGLDEILLESAFNFKVKKSNEHNLNCLIGIFNENPQKYVRKNLYFCKECISNGHHSIFHQIKLIHSCPYHQLPLSPYCPNCLHEIPYQISDQFTKAPFQCRCGFDFFSIKMWKKYTSTWRKPIKNIKLESLNKWIVLSTEQIKEANNIILFEGHDFDNYPYAMDNLISILDSNHTSYEFNGFIKHYISRSSQYFKRDVNAWDEKLLYGRIYRNIYKSIAKHLRKTVLEKHRFCIKQIHNIKGDICPYAYAYLHWNKFASNINNIRQVETGKVKHFTREGDIWGSAFLFNDDENISKLIYYLENLLEFEEIDIDSVEWIYSKVTSLILINHFYNWLRIAKKSVKKKEFYNIIPFRYQHLPFFAIYYPKQKDQSIEFHWWLHDWHNNDIHDEELKCPNNSVSKRRFYLKKKPEANVVEKIKY